MPGGQSPNPTSRSRPLKSAPSFYPNPRRAFCQAADLATPTQAGTSLGNSAEGGAVNRGDLYLVGYLLNPNDWRDDDSLYWRSAGTALLSGVLAFTVWQRRRLNRRQPSQAEALNYSDAATAPLMGDPPATFSNNPIPQGGGDGGRDRSASKMILLASVFEYAREGIIITDQQARILDVNRAFTELTGYQREEVIGQNPSLLRSHHQGDDFYTALWQSLRERGHWRGEIWNRRKNGEIYAEWLQITAVYSPEGGVSHYVGIFSDITHIKEHQLQLERLAHYDALTQLPNRVLLADCLQLALMQADQSGKMLGVAYLDLDGFKPVNDSLGHKAGDLLLMEVALRLRNGIREDDTVARLGGDEFVILLSDLTSIDECRYNLESILSDLAAPYWLQGREVRISASIGVSLYPSDPGDPDALMRHADQAMYAAKQLGRNRYHLFDPEHDRCLRVHREALSRIEAGLQGNQFLLYYQPRVDMRRGVVIGAEALVRWQHPQRGLLAPAEFLPIIENSEFSIALGDWVLKQAVRQLEIWWCSGLTIEVSVNISPQHLQEPQFVERLHGHLASHPIVPAAALELEILESTALEDMARVSKIIADCRALGVRFALDDFGTGFSSLTYFKRLPLDTLKIDQSFVRNMLKDEEDRAIVEGVIAITHAFQRQVVAEGVETVEHGLALLALGCEHGQGYGIAPPMPAEDWRGWAETFGTGCAWGWEGVSTTA
ncbi:putative bifunctional diguanylate cyclase/phosphodiesterase [Methylomagnum sp.]